MVEGRPTYRESLQIGWGLLWRMISVFLLLMIAANGSLLGLLPELTRASPPLWITLLPFAAVMIICTFAVMPVLVQIVFRTSFRGFRVRLIRD